MQEDSPWEIIFRAITDQHIEWNEQQPGPMQVKGHFLRI